MNKKIFLLAIIFCTLTFAGNPKLPKNIIIMIGDGMGVSQVSLSVITNPHSVYKEFPITGFSITCSADKLKTDSAAGGTAIACGESTNNGSIGVDKRGESIPSIFDLAKQKKLSTGIVVTCDITNATPAAFLSHTSDRRKSELIAEQIAASETDIIIGGGRQYFTPESLGGKRKDKNNLLDNLKLEGYKVFDTYNELNNSGSNKYFALFEDEDLKAADKRDYSLATLTKKALDGLSSSTNGFVLMVEGSQIDHGGHENNQHYLINELNDFERAVKTAFDFAKSNKETLVLVTSDHETGGVAITGGDVGGESIKVDFASKGHTAAMVGVFAYGPHSEIFSGINENYKIGEKLLMLLEASHSSVKANRSK